MFDTHCHLQFDAFQGRVEEIVKDAKAAGVTHIAVPGTDVETSRKAVEVASEFENVFAAVGIHPHHVFDYQTESEKRKAQNYSEKLKTEMQEIENLLENDNVVAVGEVGLDKYYYRKTKYTDYQINEEFIALQKEVFKKQVQLALEYDKSLILHNREASADFLQVLRELWDNKLEGRTVFHCCEPREELLEFAKSHKIFIGVDGDVTYSPAKQAFAKKIPHSNLVLETDSPFLTPEPQRSLPKDKRGLNTPANLPLIAEFIAKLRGVRVSQIGSTTAQNAIKLFRLD